MSDRAESLPDNFDEAAYLRLNQDVAAAVAAGVYASGQAHYLAHGAAEGRHYRSAGAEAAGIVRRVRVLAEGTAPMPRYGLETMYLSPGGALFLAGWIDDRVDALDSVRIEGEGWQVALAGPALARSRRRDVEAALGSARRHPYGMWSLAELGRALPPHPLCRVTLRMRGGAAAMLEIQAGVIEDADLRDAALAHLAAADQFGSVAGGSIASLDGGAGGQILAQNRRLTAIFAANPYVERFGPPAWGRPKGSLLVCIFGRPEYLFLQNTLFAGGAGMADYEFVFVCNSPDRADRLLADARIAALVHGLRQSVVLLAGNAGFAAANNAAARVAASDRLIALNPDVVPLHADWAARHTAAIEGLPPAQTALFGVPLYYADGSLMHGGMYFEIDAVPVYRPGGVARRDLIRVEHYGKGAPPDTAAFTRTRPVPAVTGAFLSCRRDWFERLGGFNEDYMFGHYEDADLCLRSLQAGTAPWLHDMRLWHLEGKGSTRRAAHGGGALVNRWQFSRSWADEVRAGLLGLSPRHPLLTPPRGKTRPA